MASLTGSTIAASYEQLLALPDGGLNGNNLVAITDGDSSVAIGMKVATNKIEIIPGSDDANAFEVSKADGTAVLTVNTSTVGANLIGALSVTGNSTFTTADNTDTLTLISTDTDANIGPNLRMYRNSANPDTSDSLGRIQFEGRNTGGTPHDVVYMRMENSILDKTNGSEDSEFVMRNMVAGTLVNRLAMTNTETSINQEGIDVDFRVESDGNANMLFVDAGNDRIGVGTNAPDHILDISFADTTAVNAANLDNNTVSGISVNVTGNDTNAGPVLKFTSKAKDLVTGIAHQQMGTGTADFLIFSCFGSAPVERVRVEAGGNVKVNAGNLVIGTSGKGIDFTAEAASGESGADRTGSVLDDYEEGTWSGVITDGSNDATMHSAYNTGSYTKIGNMVVCSGEFDTTDLGSVSGNISLKGLPFTNGNAAPDENRAVCSVGYASGLNIGVAGYSVSGYVLNNTTVVGLYLWDSAAGQTAMTGSEWSDNGFAVINVTYFID
jgi:hypothetical protein